MPSYMSRAGFCRLILAKFDTIFFETDLNCSVVFVFFFADFGVFAPEIAALLSIALTGFEEHDRRTILEFQ